MKKIILMANDLPGLRVAEYLINQGEKIVRLYIHNEDESKLADEIIKKSKCDKIYFAEELKQNDHHIALKNENADFIITVYWAYLLKPEIFNSVGDTINFHPAFLPINRGWYPHVHSIIDGSKLGVTLHRIDKGADTGPIWIQKEIKLTNYDTAKTIYEKLQTEIVDLFKNNWGNIKNGKIKPFHQDHSKAIYHKKLETKIIDQIKLDKKYTGQELINILRARSFGELGFAYYEVDGEKIFINLRLSDNNSF